VAYESSGKYMQKFNYILEHYTFIGAQYLPYAEESTRKGERS